MLRDIGFREIGVDLKGGSKNLIKDWFPGTGVENYVLAATIQARK